MTGKFPTFKRMAVVLLVQPKNSELLLRNIIMEALLLCARNSVLLGERIYRKYGKTAAEIFDSGFSIMWLIRWRSRRIGSDIVENTCLSVPVDFGGPLFLRYVPGP